MAKARIEDSVLNGCLDNWVTSLPLTLPSMDDRNIATLIEKATKMGWIE
jgi:hypothetical protein